MTSKRQREQRNAARAASNEVFKKRRLEARSLSKSAQPKVDDDKLSTVNTSDTEDESETWFWHESANETNSDTEEEGDDVAESDLDLEEPRIKQAVSPDVSKTEIRWNKEGEDRLRGGYGKGSRRTQMRHQKSARELRKEASKTYNIQALWKRSQDLGMLSTANAQAGLGQSTESLSSGIVCSSSEIPCDESALPSKRQIYRDKQVEALKELTRLMELVTEQEKKYEERLSPHSNFYRRHLMV